MAITDASEITAQQLFCTDLDHYVLQIYKGVFTRHICTHHAMTTASRRHV